MVLVPRTSTIPFQLKRLQLLVKLCFSTTINKARGQILNVAGLDPTVESFSRGSVTCLARTKIFGLVREILNAWGRLKFENLKIKKPFNSISKETHEYTPHRRCSGRSVNGFVSRVLRKYNINIITIVIAAEIMGREIAECSGNTRKSFQMSFMYNRVRL